MNVRYRTGFQVFLGALPNCTICPTRGGKRARLYRRRFLVSAMLRSPGGLGGGSGSGRGAGGASFAGIALKLRTRGDSG